MNCKEVLADIESRIEGMISQAEEFNKMPIELLSQKPENGGWSSIECIEHLNRYSDFYIPELNRAINSSRFASQETYMPTWLGNKSAEDMLPMKGEVKKPMKTFKSKNPEGEQFDKVVIRKFINQQLEFLQIIRKADKVSLDRTKTKTTLPLIKFKLGDTLRFVIFHEVRHIIQARKALGVFESKNSGAIEI